MFVVIPCGGRKLDRVAPAEKLYTGPYFRACWHHALSLAPKSRIFILSAKHGLLRPHWPVAPYDLRMGQKDAVRADEVRADAESLGLLTGEDMVGLGGKSYTSVMREVWPDGHYPLEGKMLGYALKWMKENKGKRL